MSHPIPRRTLPHVITVEPYLRTNGSTSVYGPAVTLSFVRVEPVRQSAQKSLGEMKNDKFKIFVDRENSTPKGIEIKAKDRVTYAGVQVIVRAVEPLTGDGPLVHHWEVYCGL